MAAKDSKKKSEQGGDSTVAVNRRGRYNYEIEESMEAGLALTGTEVKSARANQVQIAEAYARLEEVPGSGKGKGARGPEVWVHGMYIAPYKEGNVFNAEPRRKRKLLLRRDQINKLAGRVTQKGYTLVPLKLYFTRGRAKLELGIGKGRKTHDKRQVIAERETKRDLSRQMSSR
jgi:SsrA-binding protein